MKLYLKNEQLAVLAVDQALADTLSSSSSKDQASEKDHPETTDVNRYFTFI